MTLPPDLAAARRNALASLLAARDASGHWTGRLSGSAVSTAVGLMALAKMDAAKHAALIARAGDWLAETVNADGGWGDTPESPSNLAATLLARTAMNVPPETPGRTERIAQSNAWLADCAGGLEPRHIRAALEKRYGKDKTFAVPLMTAATLGGFFADSAAAWKHVAPLPFEFGVLPHRVLKFIGLPVVSYALPALIAIGQVRYAHRPPKNPLARLVRKLTAGATLNRLPKLQPSGGGFLEAAPLTGFVVMSLAAMNRHAHPTARAGEAFLTNTVREDGDWPIDTNLATWVTSLSAIALGDELTRELDESQQKSLLDWLLSCQHRTVHPFTQARPGGWGWTDLPGAVPDADDTAGALRAIRRLDPDLSDATRQVAGQGVGWLLKLQNRDGGWPTFCRGWGTLPFDTSCSDLTAHAVAALAEWRDDLPALAGRIDKATRRGLVFLQTTGRPDGAHLPLWFGSQQTSDQTNPVWGTARVVAGLRQARRAGLSDPMLDAMINAGRDFLLSQQHASGGWGAAVSIPPTIEETAATIMALAETPNAKTQAALSRGVPWLLAETNLARRFTAAPIGLYFAQLWYHEDIYPLIFTAAALQQISTGE